MTSRLVIFDFMLGTCVLLAGVLPTTSCVPPAFPDRTADVAADATPVDAAGDSTGPEIGTDVVAPDSSDVLDATDAPDHGDVMDATDATDATDSMDAPCSAGLTPCSGSCVDIGSDNANCGACGIICASPRSCMSGVCACASGYTFCSGECVNLQTDVNHCGSCFTQCITRVAPSDAMLSCMGGACYCSSPATFDIRYCSNGCADTLTDPTDCGSCGSNCGSLSCVGGVCM